MQNQFIGLIQEHNIKALAAFIDFLKESGLKIQSTFSDTISNHLSKIISDYKIVELNIKCELQEITV